MDLSLDRSLSVMDQLRQQKLAHQSEAELLPNGPQRDDLLLKERECDTAIRLERYSVIE